MELDEPAFALELPFDLCNGFQALLLVPRGYVDCRPFLRKVFCCLEADTIIAPLCD